MIDKNEFAYRLRTAMKSKQITGSRLAAECGCTHSSASQWMHGVTLPKEDKMQKIADFLEVDIEWLKGNDAVSDKELKKNAEGYTDPTAYKAMKNVLEGEKMKFEYGQIYEYLWKDSQTRSMVVVSTNNISNSCVGIIMMDEPRNPRCVPVDLGDHVEYADARTASFSPRQKIGQFLGNATDEEMENIRGELADVFGIPTPIGIEKLMNERMEMGMKISDLEKEMEIRKIQYAELSSAYEKLNKEYNSQMAKPALTDNTDLIRLQTERDIYKTQYEMLFERMMAR